jgi:anti-sigma regulatory factor (Ser/Thr protein kinase)
MPPRHSFAVSTGRDAPSAVRKALRERGAHLPQPMRDDLLLLLTEVVTNAVRHSGAKQGAPIEIEMSEARDCVRVEVTDPGRGFEPPTRLVPDLTRTGGLGLVLVDRLSRAWGTRRTAKGSLVWFELANDRDEWRWDANPA